MKRRTDAQGRIHEFPDDFTDQEITDALKESAPPQGAPTPGPAAATPEPPHTLRQRLYGAAQLGGKVIEALGTAPTRLQGLEGPVAPAVEPAVEPIEFPLTRESVLPALGSTAGGLVGARYGGPLGEAAFSGLGAVVGEKANEYVLPALGYPAPPPLTREQARKTFWTTAGTELGMRGVIEGARPLIRQAAAPPLPEAAQIQAAAKAQGVPLSVAEVTSRPLKVGEKFRGKQAARLTEASRELLEQFPRSAQSLRQGETVLQQEANQLGQQASAAATSLGRGLPIDTGPVQQTATDLLRVESRLRDADPNLLGALKTLAGPGRGPRQPLTWAQLEAARKQVADLSGGTAETMHRAILDTMGQAAEASGDASLRAGVQGLRDTLGRRHAMAQERALVEVFEQAPDRLMGDKGATTLRRLRDLLPDEASAEGAEIWGYVRRHALEGVLKQAESEGKGRITGSALQRAQKQLGPAFDQLFPSASHRQAWDNLVVVGDAIEAAQRRAEAKGGRLGGVVRQVAEAAGYAGGYGYGGVVGLAVPAGAQVLWNLFRHQGLERVLTSPRAVALVASPEFRRAAMSLRVGGELSANTLQAITKVAAIKATRPAGVRTAPEEQAPEIQPGAAFP